MAPRIALSIAALLTACWRADPRPLPVPMRAAATTAPCPFAVRSGFWSSRFWAHELVPACSPAPFHVEHVACDGACPMPCREKITNSRGEVVLTTYGYAGGRFATADSVGLSGQRNHDGTPWSDHAQCTYQGAHLASCTFARRTVKVRRDPRGRISEIEEDGAHLAVSYGSRGELVELVVRGGYFTSRLVYDVNLRLIQEDKTYRAGVDDSDGPTIGTIEHTYDAQGRLSFTSPGAARYSYDPATRLLTRVVKLIDIDQAETATFEYDARRRPRRIVRSAHPTHVDPAVPKDPGRFSRVEYVYEYDCTP